MVCSYAGFLRNITCQCRKDGKETEQAGEQRSFVHGKGHKKNIDEIILMEITKNIIALALGAIQKWRPLLQHLWLVLSADVGGAELLNISFQNAGIGVVSHVLRNMQKQRLIAMETMVKLHI